MRSFDSEEPGPSYKISNERRLLTTYDNQCRFNQHFLFSIGPDLDEQGNTGSGDIWVKTRLAIRSSPATCAENRLARAVGGKNLQWRYDPNLGHSASAVTTIGDKFTFW